VPPAFWSRSAEELLAELASSTDGLTNSEAAQRLLQVGPNEPRPPRGLSRIRLLLRQFRSPIAVLLLVAAMLSGFVGEATDAVIILAILLGSALLGFWQEQQAASAIQQLLALIRTRTCVRREGREEEIPVEHVAPGDIVVLNAGDLVPADCRLLEATDLDVDEAQLTGESFPVSKDPAPVSADAPVGQRNNAVFQGTHVVSGTATAVVVVTGKHTLYGALAEAVERRRPESAFEQGVRHFGYLLLEVTAALVLVIFAINVALHRPVLDVFMFSLALAVGLTPQLLPAIVTITLAQGARRMASKQVVVRRLVAIEDFGGMQILCTDKTGTLTQGKVHVRAGFDWAGRESQQVLRLAHLNAVLQAGFDNPIDSAIRADLSFDCSNVQKLDEVPYDFTRGVLHVGGPGRNHSSAEHAPGTDREVGQGAGRKWTALPGRRLPAHGRIGQDFSSGRA
jgi:Mg2+-importing ATPase